MLCRPWTSALNSPMPGNLVWARRGRQGGGRRRGARHGPVRPRRAAAVRAGGHPRRHPQALPDAIICRSVSRVSLMYPPRDERWIWRREGAGGEEEEDTVPPPCTSNFSILFLQNRDGQLVNIPNGYIHWKWGAIDVVGLIGFAGSNQIALQVLCKNCFLYYEKAQYFFAVNYICKCYVWLLDCSRDTIYRVLIVQFACLLLIYTVIQGVNCSVCLLVAYLHSDALI